MNDWYFLAHWPKMTSDCVCGYISGRANGDTLLPLPPPPLPTLSTQHHITTFPTIPHLYCYLPLSPPPPQCITITTHPFVESYVACGDCGACGESILWKQSDVWIVGSLAFKFIGNERKKLITLSVTRHLQPKQNKLLIH